MALVTVPVLPASAHSSRWHVTDLGALSGDCCSEASAINDRGVVVGYSSSMSGTHAFVWRRGRMTDLGTLDGRNSIATDVNNHGVVVGSSDVAGATHAFVWRHGRMTDLGTLGGTASRAAAVNDRGEVVGESTTAGGNFHAFVWRHGRMHDLGTLDDGYSVAFDVNDSGRIVGRASVDGMNAVAVQWRRGTPRRLTADYATATGINGRGQIVGYSAGDFRSFVWYRGRLTELATVPGATFSVAEAINDAGTVVGFSDYSAWFWRRGEISVLPQLVSTSGARDINNRGQIVGYGSTDQTGGNYHAVLWTR
jgi:probable HAF family extracellular repeat protein